MRIIIITKAIYPIIAPRSFRATELAKEFARQGHNVEVLTPKWGFNYAEFEKKFNIKVTDFTSGTWWDIKGKNNIFLKLFIKPIKVILKYLFLFPDIQLTPYLAKYLKNVNSIDLIISLAVPYPLHWGVALAIKSNSKLTKIWVADCGDPFYHNIESKIKLPFYFQYIENWFCKLPNYITVPIPNAVNAYPVVCRNKIKIIPQGFNFDEIRYKYPSP